MALPTVQALLDAQIPHELYRYDPGLDAPSIAEGAGLGVDQKFQTIALVAMPRVVLACIPATLSLDLEAMREGLGEPRTAVIEGPAVKRMTGFDAGSVSPVLVPGGRRFAVYLDASALDHQVVLVDSGEAGAGVVIAPGDLVHAAAAVVGVLAKRD